MTRGPQEPFLTRARIHAPTTASLFPKIPATTCAQTPVLLPGNVHARIPRLIVCSAHSQIAGHRPASNTSRRNDDDRIHEIERLQQQMQSLVAQLANERACKNSPTTRSANMASDDPVEQYSVPSAAAYTHLAD